MTVKEVAYATGLRVEDVALAERHIDQVPIQTIWRLAEFLGVDIDVVQDSAD